MNESSFGSAFQNSPEAQRLATQARGLAFFTRRFLPAIGIRPGMKVLDVGSGAGDTAFLLAEYVGSEGKVVGIEKRPELVAAARERAQAAALHQVQFINGDLFTVPLEHDFDLVYGRLILMHIQERVSLLRRLAEHVRAGGIIAFQEGDYTVPVIGLPDAPFLQQTLDWIQAIFKSSGKETQMALRIHSIFLDAGLPLPTVILEHPIIGPGMTPSIELVKALSPHLRTAGIASVEETEAKALDERIQQEAAQRQGAVLGRGLVSAWAYKH